jgi:adenylate cyclase
VDEFRDDNEGLVIAEVELRNDSESLDRPPWLGVEVTSQQSIHLGFHANTR